MSGTSNIPAPYTAVIRDSADNLFAIRDAGPEYPQAWIGIEVKRSKDGFVPKARARITLVRKAATRPVA